MAAVAGHGVADLVEGAGLGADVLQVVRCHHAFIHPVECEQVAIRRPEGAFGDAVFLAVHALAVHDAIRAVAGHTHGLRCAGLLDVQVVPDGEGDGSRGVEVLVVGIGR